MVEHTLIDVLLVNVYLDSPYYKGHCKVMCVSSAIYLVIIGNVRGARQILSDPDWKAKEKCVARPVLTRAQTKRSYKIHPFKVKEAMSSVNKSTIEDLQKKDSTLKKWFDRVEKPIIRERTMLESSS